jgi:hypothetical protein
MKIIITGTVVVVVAVFPKCALFYSFDYAYCTYAGMIALKDTNAKIMRCRPVLPTVL